MLTLIIFLTFFTQISYNLLLVNYQDLISSCTVRIRIIRGDNLSHYLFNLD